MSKLIVRNLTGKLLREETFADFKFRSRDHSLVKRTSLGYEKVELRNWEGFDSETQQLADVIQPLYFKRFDIVHSWFERFSFKKIADQRDKYSVGFDGDMLGSNLKYYFAVSKDDREEKIDVAKSEVICNADRVFGKFCDVEALYEYYIEPILKGKCELPILGADWIFEYLTITKTVNVACYPLVKKLILNHVQKLYERGEPNIVLYYPRLSEILDYLENTEL